MVFQETTASISQYLNKWVATSAGGNVTIEYVFTSSVDPVDRMKLSCSICEQTLTCGYPESAFKLDYALQKFVTLHRHVPNSIDVETNKWGYVPISTKKINRATLKDEEGRRFRE